MSHNLGRRNGNFIELLDTIIPGRNGVVFMLTAYFDASERPSGLFCVAGYAFVKPQLKKFDKEWWKVFGKYGGCHMKELAHCEGRFKGIGHAAAGELQKRGVQIIKDRVSYGIVVSCNLKEITELLPGWIDGFQHAYPVCCHLAMTSLGTQISKSGSNEDVAYIFESGDEFSGVAHRFMGNADKSPELKQSYQHASHTFMKKEEAIPLQAADMFAWEWTKYMDETIGLRKRPMRKSLIAMMSAKGEFDTRYAGIHLTGAPLKRYTEDVSRLLLNQIGEEVLSSLNGEPSSLRRKGR